MKKRTDIYRALMENLSDGVIVVDFDGSIWMVNTVACQMLGLDPNGTVGRPFGEVFVALEHLDEFTGIMLDAIVERGDMIRRLVRIPVDGEVRSLSVTTSYLWSGDGEDGDVVPEAVIAVTSDITELRELRENELSQAQVIETQLEELQAAYRDLETRNEVLSAMTWRVRRMRVAATLLVIGAFLAIGIWHVRPLDLFSATAAPDANPGIAGASLETLTTMTVAPREFRSTIALRGHLSPGQVAEVVSPIESHVSAVHVAPGDRVAVGDRLLDLDTSQLVAERRRLEVNQIKARERLAGVEGWENSPDMARARRALRRAKVALDESERHLGKTAFLLDQGIIPASQHEDAERQRRDRQLDLEEAVRELETVKARGGGEAMRVAQLEADTARDRLRENAEKLALARIVAPTGGVVMSARGSGDSPLARGSKAGQGELLLRVANLERLSVITEVNEVDVRKIEAGQRAWITGPGFPDLEVGGVVARVSSRADGGRSPTPRFRVEVVLDSLEPGARERLRVGMSSYVTIVVYDRPAVLLVPIEAVEQAGSEAWVDVVGGTDGGAVERRAVELGLTTLDSVEVVQGLSPGDRVVLP